MGLCRFALILAAVGLSIRPSVAIAQPATPAFSFWGELNPSVSYATAYDMAQYSGLLGPRTDLVGLELAVRLGVNLGPFSLGGATSGRFSFATSAPVGTLPNPSGLQWTPVSPLVSFEIRKFRISAQYFFLGSYRLRGGQTSYSAPTGLRLDVMRLGLAELSKKLRLNAGIFGELVDYHQIEISGARADLSSPVRFVNLGLTAGIGF